MLRVKRSPILIALGLVLGAGSAPAWSVFGEDHREPLQPEELVAIGKLEVAGPRGIGSCTGTLIGEKLVLTAAHCIADTVNYNARSARRGGRILPVYFYPGYDEGPLSRGTARVQVVRGWKGNWNKKGDSNAEDWALLELDREPRTGDGPISPIPVKAFATEGMALITVGYSVDYGDAEVPGIDAECSVRKVGGDGSLFHDCAIGPGASGGPLLSLFVKGKPVMAATAKAQLGEDVPDSDLSLWVVGITTREKRLPISLKELLRGADGRHFANYDAHLANIGNSAVNFLSTVKVALAGETGLVF